MDSQDTELLFQGWDIPVLVSREQSCQHPAGCPWGSTTATTATSSSRTPPPPGGATSRASSTSAPAPSGTTPSTTKHGGASSLLLPDGTLAKGICHHFVRTGTCKYGDSCRYFHPKPDGVNPALAASGPGSGPGPLVQQSDFIGNQPNFVGYQGADRNSSSGNILGGHTSWGNLPPSLQPPPEGGYPPLPFIDWG
ncbi:zinc finger CCCH domain-containing protein 3-like isoform X1 [Miscanthus floridulus]|uniref:zinc finger CCCH domain-containing protein 3-like isoform X1 n=1 Tax=Miscanthus floridulus TaxID=154761 RepID=UPI00345804F1